MNGVQNQRIPINHGRSRNKKGFRKNKQIGKKSNKHLRKQKTYLWLKRRIMSKPNTNVKNCQANIKGGNAILDTEDPLRGKNLIIELNYINILNLQ